MQAACKRCPTQRGPAPCANRKTIVWPGKHTLPAVPEMRAAARFIRRAAAPEVQQQEQQQHPSSAAQRHDLESGRQGLRGPVSEQPRQPQGKDLSGFVALLGVALLWGSYTPAIRYLYLIDSPPDPPLLNALQACLSAAFLIVANVTAGLKHTKSDPHPERSNPLMAEELAVREAIMQRDAVAKQIWKQRKDAQHMDPTQLSAALLMDKEPRQRTPRNPAAKAVSNALNWQSNSLVLGGAEVGLWMCLAFSLEVAGVQLVSATKVAFLNQVSVLITPVLVHLSGARVRGLEWASCGLGLLGSILVAADSLLQGGSGSGAHGAVAGQGNEVLGMVFVLVSAMFFALSTVRLGRYSTMYEPLKLSTTSTTALGLLSLGWLGFDILSNPGGLDREWQSLSGLLTDPTCLLTLLWVGLGPGALAAFLQASGQKSVPPAQAQVLYATTPLWAAGFAVLVLDASGEAMGPVAWGGAAVMLLSSVMTTLVPPENTPGALATVDFSSMDDEDEGWAASKQLFSHQHTSSSNGTGRSSNVSKDSSWKAEVNGKLE